MPPPTPENHVVYEIMGKNKTDWTLQRWQYSITHAHCMQDTKVYTYINTH